MTISWSDHPRTMVGLSSDYPRIVFILAEAIQRVSAAILNLLTLLALRIGNEVSYETRIKHDIHFAWQAQYLLRLEVDIACSAHSK